MIEEIYKFNTELLGVKTGEPKLLNKEELTFIIMAFDEEIQELDEAHAEQDLVGCVDAVLDLAYFAIGGCVRMGLTRAQIEGCFQAIHSANMEKKLGVKESRPQDGSIADATKPVGWEPPEVAMERIIYPAGQQLELELDGQ